MWVPVSDARTIKRGFSALRAVLSEGGARFPKHWIGSPGGRERLDVTWRAAEGIWTALPRRRANAAFSCLVGTADPKQHASLDIDVEINLPRQDVNRRYAGAFVKDDDGRVFLAHSGKIGGGHAGIGKAAFQNFFRTGHWQRVRWPDRKTSEMIVLGPLKDARITAAIAHFAAEVVRFKQLTREGSVADFSDVGATPGGAMAAPAEGDGAEARCWQGVVVTALANALRNRALHFRIEARRGLLAMSSGTDAIFFAVREDDLVGGVGDLMLNAAAAGNGARRVLVLPDRPQAERAALERLGITVLTYRWKGTQPVFAGLDALL